MGKAVYPALCLGLAAAAAASPALQDSSASAATYWQENRCRQTDLGGGASLAWCVDALTFTAENTLELHVSWRSSGLSGKRIFKSSDSDNHRMYLRDDLGRRYDHVGTRGAAREGGRLDVDRPILRGIFVFPAPQKGATAFTFHDDDQKTFISDIRVSPESRTSTSASAAILSGLMLCSTVDLNARFPGAGEDGEEHYGFRRTAHGLRLESGAKGADELEVIVPHPVVELFLRTLREAPLLERAYDTAAVLAGDYPAATLDLRTNAGEAFFFSRPAGERHAPWRAEAGGRSYLVPDDSPLRGIEILDPFLGRDPESRALALLTPHVGEERAAALWGKLEGPLDAEEALSVVRRLKPLLARGVLGDEIEAALDDYVRAATPPDPETTEPATPVSDEELFEAVRTGDFEAIRGAVSSGADPNARARDGKTALIAAAETGRAGAVQALLESGANPNVQMLGGGTALSLAARNHQREAVRLLLSAGANPKLKNTHGVTALMETVDPAIARALIRAGAEVNAADDRGLTPLMRVVSEGSSRSPAGARAETLQSLLTAGANVRARDREGRTALIWAIKGTPSSKSDSELVRMLIEAGSELEARDREGGTPLVYAAVRGDTRSARLLIETGADVNARMGNLSSLDIALRYGYTEIVTLLVRAGARR
jgi:ankyrin repeat protein